MADDRTYDDADLLARAAELTDDELEAATAPEPTEAEPVDAYIAPVEYDGVDTRTAEANYATRSNIVEP